jgi:hypothetical protein
VRGARFLCATPFASDVPMSRRAGGGRGALNNQKGKRSSIFDKQPRYFQLPPYRPRLKSRPTSPIRNPIIFLNNLPRRWPRELQPLDARRARSPDFSHVKRLLPSSRRSPPSEDVPPPPPSLPLHPMKAGSHSISGNRQTNLPRTTKASIRQEI